MHYFNNIIAGESKCLFSQLSEELLTRVLSHTHLNCENEKSALHIISNWIHEQATAIPESKILQLLHCVRFKSLNCNDLQEVASLPFIRNSHLLPQLLSAMILKLKDEPKHHENDRKIETSKLLDSSSERDVLSETPNLLEQHQGSSERLEKRLGPCCFSLSDCCKGSGRRLSDDPTENADDTNTQEASSEILNLVRDLLEVPARQLPLFPCVVGRGNLFLLIQLCIFC